MKWFFLVSVASSFLLKPHDLRDDPLDAAAVLPQELKVESLVNEAHVGELLELLGESRLLLLLLLLLLELLCLWLVLLLLLSEELEGVGSSMLAASKERRGAACE